MQGRSESLQRLHHALRVLLHGSDPHVEILRRAHVAVSGECVRTHDEVLNACGVEGGQQISEVAVHS
jgi:hypothetical protein